MHGVGDTSFGLLHLKNVNVIIASVMDMDAVVKGDRRYRTDWYSPGHRNRGIHISLAPFDCAGMSELKLLVSISCKSISSYVLYDIDAHHYDFSTLNYSIPKDVKAWYIFHQVPSTKKALQRSARSIRTLWDTEKVLFNIVFLDWCNIVFQSAQSLA